MVQAQVANSPAAVGSAVVILGDGTPVISASRSGTSIGIVVRGTLYVFDAGPGVLQRTFEARERMNLGIRELGPVFITHLHSDHTLGLPDLLFYPELGMQTGPIRHGRTAASLKVFGPPGLSAMMRHLAAAWAEDRVIRAQSPMAADNAVASRVNGASVNEISAGMVYADSNIAVTAFDVAHGDWTHALGYRIQAPDRVIVISGDTRPTEAIVAACNGCDLLLHSVHGAEGILSGTDEAYFRDFHTSAAQLGELASRANPKVLVLYHQAFAGRRPAELIAQVMSSFKGPVISARDLDVY
ncbi:MAG TPA: MBL fold metallo-hydrolase [Gemmatimonadaceae bacterium]|nr:MBL fold metallo-hydrolase [Gemmatimonadaceae bacterium]